MKAQYRPNNNEIILNRIFIYSISAYIDQKRPPVACRRGRSPVNIYEKMSCLTEESDVTIFVYLIFFELVNK